jgi:hypothetical protein
MKSCEVLNYSYMHSYIRHHMEDILHIHGTAALTPNKHSPVCIEYEASHRAVLEDKNFQHIARFQTFLAL